MISIEEIDKTILDLEQHDTTFATCEKLAWLYIVKDHLTCVQKTGTKTVPQQVGSDFLETCAGVEVGALLNILDEHMKLISVLYPREYSVIIKKTRD